MSVAYLFLLLLLLLLLLFFYGYTITTGSACVTFPFTASLQLSTTYLTLLA
jgi:hypothetical protein